MEMSPEFGMVSPEFPIKTDGDVPGIRYGVPGIPRNSAERTGRQLGVDFFIGKTESF